MPEVTDFVAKLREAFGDATIDEAVARGKGGRADFLRAGEWSDGRDEVC